MRLKRIALLLLVAGLVLCGRPARAYPALLVGRVYYTSTAQLQRLVSHFEPWEVQPEAGYAVVGVSAAGLEHLQALGLHLEVDPHLTAQANRSTAAQSRPAGGIPGYECYRTVDETYASAAALVKAHPELARLNYIGKTWDRANLPAPAGDFLTVLRLTNENISGPKPVFFAVASLHAREYTPAELLTRFAEYLVNNYGTDADVTWLLDYMEIHLLLQGNPDGRRLAEQGLDWRKNTDRSYCSSPDSYGVDLNRNFAFQWACCDGSTPDECDETYHGPTAASEPETQAIQQYLKTIFTDQRADDLTAPAPKNASGLFLDLHSYGNLVLWPWGFTAAPTGNQAALQTLGRKLAYFNHYTPQPANQLYLLDGSSIDFAYGELGVGAYNLELGDEFHESCQAFEAHVLPDNLPALLYAAKVALAPYRLPAGPDISKLSSTWQVTRNGYKLQITATASDTRYGGANEPVEAIAAAEYMLDVPYWISSSYPSHAMASVDGRFDSSSEQIRAVLDENELRAGRRILFVRAQDAAGQWGPVSALFIDRQRSVYLPLMIKP